MVHLVTLFAAEAVFFDLLVLALIIGLGAFLGWIFELIHVPSVTGYFASGILVGIVLDLLGSASVFADLRVVGEIALTFIAFELGTRLYLKKVVHHVSEVIVIVLCQSVFTIGLVFAVFMIFGAPWEMALLGGVIAMATSPETIMVLSRKYKTKGHLTDAIMPHIGFDDIVGVILFAIALAIATSVNRQEDLSMIVAVFEPMAEIIGSVLVGSAIGAFFALFISVSKKRNPEFKQTFLTESIVAVIILSALSMAKFEIGEVEFVLSPILTPMFAGILFTNLIPKNVRKQNDEAIDSFTPPFILAFFALIGMELVLSMVDFSESAWIVIGLAVFYIIFRVVGKLVGLFVGSKLKETKKEIVKYLVWTLLPQATVSVGMAKIVLNEEMLPEKWRIILFTVILIAAAVYNAVGPVLSRRALIAAKEVDPEQLTYLNGPVEKEE